MHFREDSKLSDYYLSRQPIFDVDEQLLGYELLYRDDQGEATAIAAQQATSEVFINSYIEIGLSKLVGQHQAFINVSRDFLINHDKLPPPSQQLVLEIMENVGIDDEITAAITSLIEKGYHIALDAFNYDQKHRSLVQLAHIVKINIKDHSAGDLEKLVTSLRRFPIKLLAEKVETITQYDHCRKLGFDYYQGYFLCQPRTVRGRALPANQLHVMQLLAEFQKDHTEPTDLEKIIEQDVALSYKLLRYINSAAFSLRKNVESIRHAIIILGQKEVKRWASMIALSGIENKPEELIRIALLRARMCELLTEASGEGNPGTAFMVGLFSTLDALMDTPLKELLSMIPIIDDIKAALLYRRGPYNHVLSATFAYEQGDWHLIEEAGLSEADAAACYIQAVEWSNESTRQLMKKAA